MHKKWMKWVCGMVLVSVSCMGLAGCGGNELPKNAAASNEFSDSESKITLNDSAIPWDTLPEFSGVPYVPIHNNKPFFSEKELEKYKDSKEFLELGKLDSLQRVGSAMALLSKKTIPDSPVSVLGDMVPTGWHVKKYNNIDGGSLFHRSILISSSLAGIPKDASAEIFTATEYLNKTGMIPFEDTVLKFIRKNNTRVLYRVTPVFSGTELVCRGLIMEAMSLEDKGKGLSFCVFVYNSQPDISIDYLTGDSSPAADSVKEIPSIVVGNLKSDTTDADTSKKKTSSLPNK